MTAIRRLHKRFTVSDGVIAAIRSLDLEVAEGELFVIVGTSGSGKTRLVRCIARLEVPDGGEVRIDGRIVSSDRPRPRGSRRSSAGLAWYFNPMRSGHT